MQRRRGAGRPDDGECSASSRLRWRSPRPRLPTGAAAARRELVRPWLLPAVYERLRTGRGEFLAELRPAYPLFLRFGGIDYDDDDDAIEKLDDFVRQAQQIMAGFGGNVLQLTLGDKGAYLYGVFGSPDRPRGRRGAGGRGGARAA